MEQQRVPSLVLHRVQVRLDRGHDRGRQRGGAGHMDDVAGQVLASQLRHLTPAEPHPRRTGARRPAAGAANGRAGRRRTPWSAA
ncbi:hypothetical protein [Ornithinimicrobium kibberense]|uniref:hypothetical protein n=1 Tax=Ornithinimicrobium kibberense TaxID=282060 RepID=UPI0036147CCD